jgi:biofilm PGA synthesis N-glycosyltransferase PgaC
MMLPVYVLITPARNEARFIELTVKSVLRQKVRPLRWVIVSDGSTDGTDEIVSKHVAIHPWIELVRMPQRRERHFSGKVQAFRAGYARLSDIKYDVIVNLDGDVSFDEEYFSFLLQKLAEDPALGVVGTPFQEGSNPVYDYRFVNIEHVSGACQMFRRQCFQEIGGYVPIEGGGVDYVAVTTARMKGWKTKTFTEKVCHHHRDIGTAQGGLLAARFRYGVKDYALGNHPIWEILRAVHQLSRSPILVGGLALASGYCWALIRGDKRPVSRELMAFIRCEQMQRSRKFLMSATVSTIRRWNTALERQNRPEDLCL